MGFSQVYLIVHVHFTEEMKNITDIASSPIVAAPAVTSVVAANIVSLLPIFINVATAIYLVLLIGHKVWSWYKEYKGKQPIEEDGLP